MRRLSRPISESASQLRRRGGRLGLWRRHRRFAPGARRAEGLRPGARQGVRRGRVPRPPDRGAAGVPGQREPAWATLASAVATDSTICAWGRTSTCSPAAGWAEHRSSTPTSPCRPIRACSTIRSGRREIKDDPAWTEGLERATAHAPPSALPGRQDPEKAQGAGEGGQRARLQGRAAADRGDVRGQRQSGGRGAARLHRLRRLLLGLQRRLQEHHAGQLLCRRGQSRRRDLHPDRSAQRTPGWRRAGSCCSICSATTAEKFQAPEQAIRARIVVLAAGTIGSTEILLRSREKGLALSSRLGGASPATATCSPSATTTTSRSTASASAIRRSASIEPVGPCITGLIDLRSTPELEDGMVIEEGSLPSALAPMLPALFASGAALPGCAPTTGWRCSRG